MRLYETHLTIHGSNLMPFIFSLIPALHVASDARFTHLYWASTLFIAPPYYHGIS